MARPIGRWPVAALMTSGSATAAVLRSATRGGTSGCFSSISVRSMQQPEDIPCRRAGVCSLQFAIAYEAEREDAMNDSALRTHLVELLQMGHAHLKPDAVFKGLPFELWSGRPDGAPHTPWELLEHLRFTQWDILEFSRNPEYVEPK